MLVESESYYHLLGWGFAALCPVFVYLKWRTRSDFFLLMAVLSVSAALTVVPYFQTSGFNEILIVREGPDGITTEFRKIYTKARYQSPDSTIKRQNIDFPAPSFPDTKTFVINDTAKTVRIEVVKYAANGVRPIFFGGEDLTIEPYSGMKAPVRISYAGHGVNAPPKKIERRTSEENRISEITRFWLIWD